MLRGRLLDEQDGFALLEVIVAAALLAVMVVAVFTTFDVANHVSGQEKARAVAASLAQREQEFMRSLPAAKLSEMADKGEQSVQPEQVDNVQYTITRSAQWLARGSQRTSCSTDSDAADYMKIVSTVRAPASTGIAPVTLTSVVSPPAGSFDASQGSLAINVVDASAGAQPGVNVTLSGPGYTASRTTDTGGCAYFGEQPTGDYTVTLSAANMVDPTGNAAPSKVETIAPEATTTDTLQYDVAASRTAHFVTQKVDSAGTVLTSLVDAKWTSVMFAPPGSAAPARKFTSTSAQTTIAGTSLFPFTSAYALYAGDCTGARPADAVAAAPRPAVPTSALATDPGEAIVLMPVVNITVKSATNAAVSGAKIFLTAKSGNCSGTYQLGGTTATTDSTGRLPVAGAGAMPFGGYDLCVVDSSGHRYQESYVAANPPTPAKGVDNTGPAGFSKTVQLGSTTGGSCP
jgi:prepilin-type N-terminal cleavage/methylation domain-containing protein